MDPSYVKLVVEQLARLHAASHHYLDHFPDGGIDGFKRAHPLFINDRWLFSKSAGAKLNWVQFDCLSKLSCSGAESLELCFMLRYKSDQIKHINYWHYCSPKNSY